MKRVVSIFLAIVLASAISCLADIDIDFTKYTERELMDIGALARQELASRQKFQGDELWPDKVYVVGVDIDPGIYNVMCVDLMRRVDGLGFIDIYNSVEDYNNKAEKVTDITLGPGYASYANLEEGQCLVLDRGIFAFEKIG